MKNGRLLDPEAPKYLRIYGTSDFAFVFSQWSFFENEKSMLCWSFNVALQVI